MKKIFITIIIALITISVCACAGAGDWDIPLTEHYTIIRVNGHCVHLAYKETLSDPGATVVLDKFYVTSFQMHEPYICIKGIETEGDFATEEEIRERVTVCYLINTDSDEITGPFATDEEFCEHCISVGVTLDELWMPANNKVSEQFKNK